jgi:membrane-bound lytic murein transglycosylase B
MSDILNKREPTIRTVAQEKGVDPELILALLALESDHGNLHAYGARSKLRRAAETLIDAALAREGDADSR